MARRFLPRPARALGHRGEMLTVYGSLWVIFGIGLLIEGDPASRIVTPLVFIPAEARALAWILTGVWAIFIAWRPITRYRDASAWVALYLMPAIRAASYLIAWVDSHIPWGADGHPSGWLHATLYGAIVWGVWACARWPEEPRITERTSREVGDWLAQRAARAATRRARTGVR